jgi:hypothetical protein
MKIALFLILIVAIAAIHFSCSLRTNTLPPKQVVMISPKEDNWYLKYTSEEEFERSLPLAKSGDIEAIKKSHSLL